MTENWIHANEQSVLTFGENDISVTIPVCNVSDYAQMAIKGEPIKMPTGHYLATGWCHAEGNPDRAIVRLSRDRLGFVGKPKGVKLSGGNNIDWRLSGKL